MTTAHPTPWTFETHELSRGYSSIVYDARGGSLGRLDHLDEETARLIAAAPELYAQLKDAKLTLESVAKVIAGKYPSLANNSLNQCAIRCGDVLAKARGEDAPK